MTSRGKRKQPFEWVDVTDNRGVALGRYAIDGRMIVVRSGKGWEKRTQVGNPEAVKGLARLILSEGPPQRPPPRLVPTPLRV